MLDYSNLECNTKDLIQNLIQDNNPNLGSDFPHNPSISFNM